MKMELTNLKCCILEPFLSFAKMFLQIPVEDGFSGGDFELKNRNQTSETFETSRNSHRYCYLTVFYNDFNIMIDPIETGSRLELVFDLCHDNSVGRVPQPNPPQFSEKQKKFQNLFSCWKENSWVDLIAIPLDHSYSKSNLTFASLKGADRIIVDQIVSLLGDFVDVHLATVTKYIGYNNEDDWAVSGIHRMKRKKGGNLKIIRERDWTEYWAGDWNAVQDCQLKSLPPLEMFVPDHLLGHEETVFEKKTEDENFSNFEGLEFKRQMVILWPRKKIFNIAIAFRLLDQALDFVEENSVAETKELEMNSLIQFCEEHPAEAWCDIGSGCDNLRCVNARGSSSTVMEKRALRLINLCLRWKMKNCGLELINLLFKTDFVCDVFRCWNCYNEICDSYSSSFVGGVCSDDVASALAELIDMVGWDTGFNENISKFHIGEKFDVKHIGHLAHLVVCLVNHNCLDGAKVVRDEIFEILKMENHLKNLKYAGESFGSCIAMLALVDGLFASEDVVLDKLFAHFKTFSAEHSLHVIGWLSKIDTTLFKSITQLDYYPELLANLESKLKVCNFPNIGESFTKQEIAAAQLMSSYLKLQDGPMLKALIDRITSPGSRILLSSVLCTRNAWTVPSSSLVDATLAQLVAGQFQQLSQFTTSIFSSKQHSLPEHSAVELFLRSNEKSMTYNLANEEEAQKFVSKFFCRRLAGTSVLMAECNIVKTFVDGESKICVAIRKNWDSAVPEPKSGVLFSQEAFQKFTNWSKTRRSEFIN